MTHRSAMPLFMALFLAHPQFVHSQAAKGSVDGFVRDAKSNEPIPGARVTLMWSPTAEQIMGDPSLVSVPPPIPSVTSDAQGRFGFADLAFSGYWLSVQANGYVRREGVYFGGGGEGAMINVSSATPIKDLAVRLTPTGNVSGRLVDNHGAPAVNVPVQLTKYTYNSVGQRYLNLTASTKTDDRGEYRLYFVAPGRYFVGAGTSLGPGRDFSRAVTNEVPELYSYTYYPNVSEVEQASPVEVQSGAEIKGIDMRLNPQKMYRIRGRVLDSRTGQPPAAASISLNYSAAGGSGSFGSGLTYKAATGEFELQNVIPGSYGVVATVQTTPTSPPPAIGVSGAERIAQLQAATRSRLIAQVPVKVVNSDVEGLLLIVGGFSIAGRVRVEGQETSPALDLTRWRAQVRPVIDGRPVTITNVVPSQTNPDGTFRVDSMVGGEYQVGMSAPPGFYLKGARLGDKDLLIGSVTLSETPSSTLEILLSPKVGQVDGTVVNDRGQPTEASHVVLIPNSNRDRAELFRTAVVDQTGRFTATSVPPGDYKILAWETLEPYSFFDPEVLKRYEQLGKPVHVEESSRITIEVPRIPATP